MKFTDTVTQIKGVGEKTEKLFHKVSVFTAGDLLEYFPYRYDSYEPLVPVGQLKEGETAAVCVTLAARPQVKKARSLTILSVRARDETGDLMLTWFHMPYLKNSLKMGTRYIFRGQVSRRGMGLEMGQPAILSKEEYYNKLHCLQPEYHLTSGLTNRMVTKCVGEALASMEFSGEYLPSRIRKECGLILYRDAVKGIHFPKNRNHVIEARRRLVFDELFLFELSIQRLKQQRGKEVSPFSFSMKKEVDECIAGLPYRLTGAQQRVYNEIQKDLLSGSVMNRLVQGDVGSGKTAVAALALLFVVKNGFQGAMMVPTEVLAKQHEETLQTMLGPFGVRVGLLTGSMTAKEKRLCYQAIEQQEVDVVVGTHALIQEKVLYQRLALVITDEQHRFGVRQRESFSEKGEKPHVLVMSATPIPRTLAIILYGDLDLSVIDELPRQRLPIKTCVVDTGYRPTAYHFIEKELAKGRQAYVICPMVEESETMEAENVLDYTERLRNALAPSITIAYLHGKMKAQEKNEIMERFASGEIQVLVSTTVVEVGVDVPNAAVIMIENAERFGLAQLHQLRGRVGRGDAQSYCILMYGIKSRETMERLDILNRSNDGFYIAREDLRLRGPGDFFGIRQSGLMEFKIADVFEDAELLRLAHQAAASLSEKEKSSMVKNNPWMQERMQRYLGSISL